MKLFISAILFFLIQSNVLNAQLRIRNDEYIQIGYDEYRTLTFGTSSGQPNNGAWGIEYWEEGLNFWKPWPTQNSSNYILFLRDDHNIGIGSNGSPNYRLFVNGNVAGTGFWLLSDQTMKSGISRYNNGLAKILQIQPYTYSLKNEGFITRSSNESAEHGFGNNLTKSKSNMTIHSSERSTSKSIDQIEIGLLAQELRIIIPEAVREDSDGILNINYTYLIPVLISATKEQNEKIISLERRLSNIEKRQ